MNPIPIKVVLHKKSHLLTVTFDNERIFNFPCQYLRVYSPSAEVRGHGSEPRKLVLGKENVNIVKIEPVGNYAIKLVFDDGHDSGLYSWEVLYDLGINQEKYWQDYLLQIAQAGIKFL